MKYDRRRGDTMDKIKCAKQLIFTKNTGEHEEEISGMFRLKLGSHAIKQKKRRNYHKN